MFYIFFLYPYGLLSEIKDLLLFLLQDSTIKFTEDKDVITATITDIKYRTELFSEYLVEYKLLHKDTFKSISVHPILKKTGRDLVLQITFSDQTINSRYGFCITPLISSPEYNGVFGVSSNIIHYNSGCLQYTGLPSCNHWCVCRDDPGTLCHDVNTAMSAPQIQNYLLKKNVNFELTDITTNSLTIQFIDAHPDLPYLPLCIIRLGIDHANISSLASNTDNTYNKLNPNTTYAIDITAVLEDGVLSRSWTLTAATLTESSDNSENVDNSDNILPVVVGCVVSVTGIVALLVVIGVIHKR